MVGLVDWNRAKQDPEDLLATIEQRKKHLYPLPGETGFENYLNTESFPLSGQKRHILSIDCEMVFFSLFYSLSFL